MDYSAYTKKFSFPPDFQVPTVFNYQDLEARPLSRNDLKEDMEAVNSSLELIRKTRGGSWPSEPVSEEFDLLDLAWHEREFREGDSFAYVVYNKHGDYVGCFYLYPMGHRTQLNDSNKDYGMDASWWVSAAAYKLGYYEKLYSAMQQWLKDFPVDKILYSNSELPS